MANVEGKATAITVVTPLKWYGPIVLWLVFWAGRNIKSTLKKLEELSFIHYARWAVIERFPGGESGGERLHHTYLFFESNFNGTWDQYIEAFSEVVAFRMKAIWGTSFGFPGPLPVEPFKQYIRTNEYVANHYWSAYPGATTTEIVAAARVEKALAGLRESSLRFEGNPAAMDDVVYEGPPQKRDHLKFARLLFTSNFDGPLDPYLEGLRTGLAETADAIWGHCLGYPGRAVPSAFSNYMRAHQIGSALFFSAYGERTVAEVKRGLALRSAVIDFALRAQGMDAAELQAAFRQSLAR